MSLSPMLVVMAFVVVFSISRDPAISAVTSLLLTPFLHVAARALAVSACRKSDVKGGADLQGASRHFVPCAFCREPGYCSQRRD